MVEFSWIRTRDDIICGLRMNLNGNRKSVELLSTRLYVLGRNR